MRSANETKDYSLHSGERQTGTEIAGIRQDHTARYQKSIDIIAAEFENSSTLAGLDLFCANGYGASMLVDQLGCWLIGIDASQEAISQAQTFYSRQNILFCEKIFPFDLPAATFDFVTCIESIEHTEHYLELAQSLLKCLKPGGMLFISTPNEDVMPFRKNEMPFHVKHFGHDEIVQIFTGNGASELVQFFGQDAYVYEDSKRIGLLEESEMGLSEATYGQFQLYAFRKN